jgi:hypothetical protein
MKRAWVSSLPSWRTASAGMLAVALWALAGGAAAQIANTRHNLGTASTQPVHVTAGTAEICVFCHTPHGGDTQAPVPLWNKRLATPGSAAPGGYTTYASLNTPSLDGEILPVGSISVACLSCHDGTQAMDNIINAPGSGGFDATGGGDNGLAYTWLGANAAGMMPAGVANLGTNLSNDHPIGIEYCGGGLTAGTGTTAGQVTGTCRDGDFNRTGVRTATINSNQVFWIETGVSDNAKTRTDLPLYTRTFAARGAGPSVECGSCHDPHVAEGQTGPNGQVAGATFLRISNASSAVCTACHVK